MHLLPSHQKKYFTVINQESLFSGEYDGSSHLLWSTVSYEELQAGYLVKILVDPRYPCIYEDHGTETELGRWL
jgi:hypothetical protein